MKGIIELALFLVSVLHAYVTWYYVLVPCQYSVLHTECSQIICIITWTRGGQALLSREAKDHSNRPAPHSIPYYEVLFDPTSCLFVSVLVSPMGTKYYFHYVTVNSWATSEVPGYRSTACHMYS